MDQFWWKVIVLAVVAAIIFITYNVTMIILYNWRSGKARKSLSKIDRSVSDLQKGLDEINKDLP
ncbi:MAG: hypothetical protein ABIA67_04920 [Candidatus Margulisiibacteriota bacterium]